MVFALVRTIARKKKKLLWRERVCSNTFVSFHQVYGATSRDGLFESQVFLNGIELDKREIESSYEYSASNSISNEDAKDLFTIRTL